MNDHSATRFTDMPPLAHGEIKDEVRNLPEAVFNKLQREWPAHWPSEQGPKDLLLGIVRTSQFTFRSILYLISDDPAPFKRPEFAVALPPLVRSLLDALVTLILLFDDLPKNSRWYFRAGWRDLYESYERYGSVYGDDPLWKTFAVPRRDGWNGQPSRGPRRRN